MASNDDDFELKSNTIFITVENATIVISTISLIFSLSVVFILLYRYEALVAGKPLIAIVLFIAISDTLVSLAYSFGYPTGILCNVQGLLAETFEKVSWIATDLLMLNIYGIVVLKKVLISAKLTCIITCLIVILLIIIQYSVGVGYGNSPEYDGISRCSFHSFTSSASANHLDNVIGSIQQSIVVFTLAFIFILLVRVLCFLNSSYKDSGRFTATQIFLAQQAFSTMSLYPASILICWLPSQILDIYQTIHNSSANASNEILLNSLYILSPINGLFLSIIFYAKTSEAKNEWLSIFRRLKFIKETSDLEMRESTSNVIVVRITDAE